MKTIKKFSSSIIVVIAFFVSAVAIFAAAAASGCFRLAYSIASTAIEDTRETEAAITSRKADSAAYSLASNPVTVINGGDTETVSPSDEEPVVDEPQLPGKNCWEAILVNRQNPMPEDYTVELTKLSNGHSVDSRCYDALQNMMDDCRADGNSPLICSSYRTSSTQEYLFKNKINTFISWGYSQQDAYEKAATIVAIPGTSEHQLGLAVDIVDSGYQVLDVHQEETATQKWLVENSWKYGFILRYPNDKSDVTGIIYEPWHYRYVGADIAAAMHELGVCFEEYIDLLNAQ